MHDVTGPIDTLFVAGGDGTRAAASDPDFFFFFNDTATTDIYTTYDTLSLHDALPIYAHEPVQPRADQAARVPVHRARQLRATAARRDVLAHAVELHGVGVRLGHLPVPRRLRGGVAAPPEF